jgi:hypothetical protein
MDLCFPLIPQHLIPGSISSLHNNRILLPPHPSEYSFVFNVAGFPGRFIPVILADYRIVPVNTLVLTLACNILFFVWIAVSSLASLIAFAIIYGFVSDGV